MDGHIAKELGHILVYHNNSKFSAVKNLSNSFCLVKIYVFVTKIYVIHLQHSQIHESQKFIKIFSSNKKPEKYDKIFDCQNFGAICIYYGKIQKDFSCLQAKNGINKWGGYISNAIIYTA